MRGIAIALVLLVHTFYAAPRSSLFDAIVVHAASTGWIGVDLFFVLSGFLITGILIDAKESVNYFAAFYARRFLRIVPAYVAFVLFSMWLAPRFGILSSEAASETRHLQAWYWSYTLNILIAIRGWAGIPSGSHLWSLSVEEQFYLLWPAAVWWLTLRGLQRLTVACFIAAEAIRIVVLLLGMHPEANYVLLPSRMDTLAVGAFLACAFRTPLLWPSILKWRRRAATATIPVIVSIILLYHILDFHRAATQLLGFPALAILAGVLVASAVANPSWMSNQMLRILGRYSYAMYLWHGLAIVVVTAVLARVHFPTLWGTNIPYYIALLPAVLLGTTAIAIVSWLIVEKPSLALKRFVPYVDKAKSLGSHVAAPAGD